MSIKTLLLPRKTPVIIFSYCKICMYRFLECLEKFWMYHPALRFSLLFSIGFMGNSWLLLPRLFLFFFCRYRNHLFLSFLLPCLGWVHIQVHKPSYPLRKGITEGIGYFIPTSLRELPKGGYFYKGYFSTFISKEKKITKNVPCTIVFRGKNRPSADYSYILQGSLTLTEQKIPRFKQDKSWQWIIGKKNLCLHEFRYRQKKKIKKYLSQKIPHTHAKSLMSSLATGEVDNLFLRFGFTRLGLSHLLAISGFHFALVISLASFLCKKFFPKNFFLLILLSIACAYFLFLGMSPSVFRAWLLVVLYIFASFFAKQARPMNIIGVVLGVNLLLSPMDIFHLGFQLSYLSYSAIILLFPIVHKYLSCIIQNHTEENFSFCTNISHKVLLYFRSAMGVNIAVHIVIFPLLLYYFGKFPLYSLIYNLFIPLIISLVMYFLFLALLFPYLFIFLEKTLIYLLRIILYPPTIFEWTVYGKGPPLDCTLIYLCIIFLGGAYLIQKVKKI